MSKNNSSNKVLLIVMYTVLAAIVVFIFIQYSGGANSPSANTSTESNVTIKDGVQYITIDARGGYKPRETIAKGGIPTILIMNTKNTYDCSAALVVRKANYRDMLPPNAKTEINLGTPKSGDTIPGTCSMGMYNFTLKFN